jgi:hypothetical protein
MNWTFKSITSSNPNFYSGWNVCWNGSVWAMTGFGPAPSYSALVMYSYDGLNWTQSTSGSSYAPLGDSRALGTDGNKFLTVGQQAAYVYTSTNGIDWTQTSTGSVIFDYQTRVVAYNGQLWVAGGGTTNTLAYSTNGLSWTAAASGIFPNVCNAVVWNGVLWVAGGGNNGTSIAYSYNGINWTASASANAILSYETYMVSWNGSVWTATGRDSATFTNRVINSYDGINWTANTAANTIAGGAVTIASRRALPYIGTKVQGGPTGPTGSLPVLLQYGTGTTHGTTFDLPVTFGTAFASRPTITATVTDGSATWVSVGSASTTGFTAYTWNASGGAVSKPLNWQAIL